MKRQVSSHWCQPGLGSKEKCPSLSLLGHSICTGFTAAPNVFKHTLISGRLGSVHDDIPTLSPDSCKGNPNSGLRRLLGTEDWSHVFQLGLLRAKFTSSLLLLS